MAKYGLIGGKLGHSFSKGIHEMYFSAIGEESAYELIEVSEEDIEKTLMSFSREGYSGINVTIPHKKEVIKYLDEISPEAKSIGAVNTIKFSGGKMIGYNTDYYGFGKTLEKGGIEIQGKNVYILGTGGASYAVSAYCREMKAKVTFVSRTPSDNAIGYDEFEKTATDGILVNCTPVGMYPNTDATPTEHIKCFDAVVDIIYNPLKTKLMELAEGCGIKAVNGLYMLVAQAICAQGVWHGTEFDEDIIDKIYVKIKEQMEGNKL